MIDSSIPKGESMSYCRWGWDSSDVYIYESGPDDEAYLVCCGCDNLKTFGELLAHIDQHRADGDHVPPYVDERIFAHIEAGDTSIPAGDIPAHRVPDPGPQRPEPEEFTRLKARLNGGLVKVVLHATCGAHRGPEGPNEDLGQCSRCHSLTAVMRPPGETYGHHLPDCSLPLRHPSFCEPGGDGHPPAPLIRGYWK